MSLSYYNVGKMVLEFLEKQSFRYGVCVSVSSVFV